VDYKVLLYACNPHALLSSHIIYVCQHTLAAYQVIIV